MSYNVFPSLFCRECGHVSDVPKVSTVEGVLVRFYCFNAECASEKPLELAGMIFFGEHMDPNRLPRMVHT